ncbi:MAG: thiamine-phosphate kinase [Alphaproteobacteria bacterium]|nr:thiamine-phosphate kinase [Alphaproteobacteria bacterium]
MKLSDIGEFGLIDRFSKDFLKNLPKGITGIGDDAAVIPWNQKQSLLITTDMLIEESHFIKSTISPEELGHKSLAVNLSDIAAMGGTPTFTFLSLGLTPDLTVEWVDRFFKGFKSLAEKYSVRLLGGDTTKSKKSIIINVTVLGNIQNKHIKFRSLAKQGDLVCVTGMLGDSSAGLKFLLEQKPISQTAKRLVRRHHQPEPHISEGQWLGQKSGVHAMIDVSDGIGSDAKHLIKSSRCGIEIHLDRLPLSEDIKSVCATHKWNTYKLASSGGEDYCLLLTVDPKAFAKLSADFLATFHRPLFMIGEITGNIGILNYSLHGKPYTFENSGWDHFKKH